MLNVLGFIYREGSITSVSHREVSRTALYFGYFLFGCVALTFASSVQSN